MRTRLKTGALTRHDYSAYLAASSLPFDFVIEPFERQSFCINDTDVSYASYSCVANISDIEEPKAF